MKKKYCLIVVIILFTACQKGIEPFDDNGSTQTGSDIKGTWKFLYLTGHTEALAEYTESGIDYKTITTSDYTTTNNTGTITFDDSTITGTNLSYSISSSLNGYNYQNNVLTDSVQMPFIYGLDSTNSSGKYKLIGSDSIYFPGGFIEIADSATEAQPGGGKISIVGDKLTLTESIYIDTTQIIIGIPYHTADKGTFNYYFQKQ